MHIAFYLWPEPGHFYPTKQLTLALLSRGHRVTYFVAKEAFAELVRQQGFDCSVADPDGFTGLLTQPGAMGPDIDLVLTDSLYEHVAFILKQNRVNAAIYATNLSMRFDPLVPPPRVLRIFHTGESGWVARLQLKIAWLQQAWQLMSYIKRANSNIESKNIYITRAGKLAKAMGRKLRWNEWPLLLPGSLVEPEFVFCPREYDFKRSNEHGLVWLGPAIDTARSEDGFPWVNVIKGVPLVYCSFGTQTDSLFRFGMEKILKTIVRALSKEPVQLVVSAPPSLFTEADLSLSNVMIVPNAPQLALLKRSSLMITHCGFNSIKESIFYGVPMLAIPMRVDQYCNASLVVNHHRLGTALTPQQVTDKAIKETVMGLLENSAVRDRCKVMQNILRNANTNTGVQEIETLAARHVG